MNCGFKSVFLGLKIMQQLILHSLKLSTIIHHLQLYNLEGNKVVNLFFISFLFKNFVWCLLCYQKHWANIIFLLHECHHFSDPRLRRRFQVNLNSNLSIPKRRSSRRQSQALHSGRARDNGHILKQEIVRWDIGKSFYTMRTVEQWKRLPREAVQFPPLEVFQDPTG